MKQNNKKLVSLGIMVLLLTWFIYYILNHINEFEKLSIVSPNFLLLLIVLALIATFFGGVIMIQLTIPFKIYLSLLEGFGLSIISSFYNYLLPGRGGAVIRGAYLKMKHRLSVSEFVASLSGMYIITFWVNTFIGVVIMILLYSYEDLFSPILFITFSGLFILLSLIIIFSPQFKSRKGFIGKIIHVINGWHKIKSNKRLIIVVAIVTILQFVLLSTMTFIEFKVFGLNISLLSAMLIAITGTLSLLISVTPGSLGIKEAFIVYSSHVVGVTTTQAIAISLLDRAVFMTVLFILGPIFSYTLLKTNPTKPNKKKAPLNHPSNPKKTKPNKNQTT